jgi:hypothetical protein
MTRARRELDTELAHALEILATRTGPRGIYTSMFALVRAARGLGLTDERVQAILAAIMLGASYRQALEMLGARE